MNPSVFLGLVTHQASRFAASRGQQGLLASVQRELDAHGVTSATSIHDADHFDSRILPLTQVEVKASIAAELSLEKRWRTYVRPTESGIGLSSVMALRHLYRRVRLAPPWRRSPEASPRGSAMLRRLVNIELAHLHLLEEAHATGASWALIVEDDAHIGDPQAFARNLADFMETHDSGQPTYVNVSRSFTHDDLALEGHLAPVGQWSDSVRMLASDIPLTNTVCAILYRGSFLATLLPALADVPVSPVLPIDWKLNQALLDLVDDGRLGPGDCWFLDPAPVLQGSMHEPGAIGAAG